MKNVHLGLMSMIVSLLCGAVFLQTSSRQQTQSPEPQLGSSAQESSQPDLLPVVDINSGDSHNNSVHPDDDRVQPILPPGETIPEVQLWSDTHHYFDSPILGSIVITGGMAEPHGHSWKGETQAILSNQPDQIQMLPPSNRNLGFDYVVRNAQLGDPSVHPKAIRNLWPGTIHAVQWESGYGLRCHIDFDITFQYQGKSYPLYGAYAHAENFSVEPGQHIAQGEPIGIMGSTGGNYGEHVDLRLWIVVHGQRVDVSPNLIDAQLHS